MSEMESGGTLKGKSKKKKSKKSKSTDNETPRSVDSVEKLHSLKQSLPECSVTVTAVKKNEVCKEKGAELKGEIYSLSSFQEKIASSGKNENKTAPSGEKAEVDLNKLSEITVIRTDPNNSVDKAADAEVSEACPTSNADENKTSQKKKSKKKKKKSQSISESSEPENNENVAPAEPTYVKLPSTGDACVLIVSHESFGSSDSSKANSGDITLKNIEDLSDKCNSVSQNSDLQTEKEVISNSETLALEVQNEYKPKNKEKSKVTSMKTDINKMPTSNSDNLEKGNKKSKEPPGPKNQKLSNQTANKDLKGKMTKTDVKKTSQNKTCSTTLFSHLPSYKSLSTLQKHLEGDSDIPSCIATVSIQSFEDIVFGSDARCISVLAALEEIIRDYQTPMNKELSRDLEAKCQSYVCSIGKFRPLPVSVLNAIKFLKLQITNISPTATDREAKANLIVSIRKFVREEIYLAKAAICEYASAKVVDGDVILTYSYSDVVKELLCEASSQGKNFKVVVVDSKPKLEGKEMLRCLLKCGVQCSYILINGISYVMKEVSKVFIGADSLLANGYVMSKIGSSQIALIASAYNVPFLVCCETYKFCERVHTDSFDYNEVGDSSSFNINLKDENPDKEQNLISNLRLLNVLYDITPPTLVSMVITEKGVLPCTSVPVVLRVRHSGMQE